MRESQIFSNFPSTMPKDIFLVYGSLRMGGIETMIVRIANHLVGSGSRVVVCCAGDGPLDNSLNSKVGIIKYCNNRDLVRSVEKVVESVRDSRSLLVITFDSISAARGLIIESALSKKSRAIHLAGIFHPRAYFMDGERKDRIFLNYLVGLAVGAPRLFFMNDECKKSHSLRWRTDLTLSSVIALPINLADFAWCPTSNSSVRIVSVGRLVDFKMYNIGVARIVEACLAHGVDVTWDIYGDGPLRAKIEGEIHRLNLMDRVKITANLDYGDFSSTVARYDLFVGMGTAALEAAMIGVPTICATVDVATECYGYIYELPFGNVGELLDAPPHLAIAELIQSFAGAEESHKYFLSQECRAAAVKYGVPEFISSIEQVVGAAHAGPPVYFKHLVAKVYEFATDSILARFLRRVAGRQRS